MGFASVEEIETRAKEQECQLWETILHDDMTERQVDRLESIGKMSSMYPVSYTHLTLPTKA